MQSRGAWSPASPAARGGVRRGHRFRGGRRVAASLSLHAGARRGRGSAGSRAGGKARQSGLIRQAGNRAVFGWRLPGDGLARARRPGWRGSPARPSHGEAIGVRSNRIQMRKRQGKLHEMQYFATAGASFRANHIQNLPFRFALQSVVDRLRADCGWGEIDESLDGRPCHGRAFAQQRLCCHSR